MPEFNYDIVKTPLIFQQNRLPAHSDHEYFRNENEAVREQQGFRTMLNGSWYFAWAKNYEMSMQDFYRTDVNCRTWDTIRVPGHIQMQGYGAPMYVNTEYPWDGHEEIRPGEIPAIDNPTGSYVRYFKIPSFMKGRPVYISFQGVESGLALWLNGRYIGYSEDSFTPSEFELTEAVDYEGENKLAVMVFRYTAGSWCEDQDFFRFSGIFRDVYLYTVPEVHIWDLKVETSLDEPWTDAELSVSVKAGGRGRAELRLLDPSGELVQTASLELTQEEKSAQAVLQIQDPKKWSAEYPNLYVLEILVRDEDGKLQEVIRQETGFRRFELIDRVMCLNGKRIVFNGVNRHEFSAESGRCIRDEDILKDLLTMKRNNINAVRTSHYPNRSFLYRMCDRLGLYLIDETNLETHGIWDAIIHNLEPLSFSVPGDWNDKYLELILDRARSMFERDKNHPSILIWSCGNEAYGGETLQRMHDAFRRWDPSRLVHYEPVIRDNRYPDTTDMVSAMYLPVAEVKEYLESRRNKPFIMCEYTHAMGNSCGGMHKYTDLAASEPLFQGGFIWDYIDQSITKKDRYGREFQAYGGDFDDRPNDGSFSGNGIVYGRDRDPSPKMQEVRYNYQNYTLGFADGCVIVTNRSLFTDADAYDLVITLEREGEELQRWQGSLAVPPVPFCADGMGDCLPADYYPQASMEIPFAMPTDGDEYVLTASLCLKEDTAWAKRGHEVAFGQQVIGIRRPFAYEELPCEVSRGWVNLGVRGDGFEALFSDLFGGFISLKQDGRELLKQAPKPNFWRPLTENDNANLLPFRAGQWKLASMYVTHKTDAGLGVTSYDVTCPAFPKDDPHFDTGGESGPAYAHLSRLAPGHYRIPGRELTLADAWAEVAYTYHLPVRPAMDCRLSFKVHGDGWIDVTLSMDASAEVGELPEFGVIFPIDADIDQLTWYGYGPDETYADRNHAKLGLYRCSVADNFAKYLVPQECGNKTGVRFATITDRCGRGIRIEGQDLNLSVLPWSPHEIDCARHPNELPLPLYTWVRVSLAQMGIGGDDTWGAQTHPEYRIDNSKPLSFTFRMKAI